MFGYVNIDKMELKFKEYYKYRGYYCGLCMNLKHNHNELSRLTLNYDMTFLILLLSSLYETNDRVYTSRCIAHPIEKRMKIENEITSYASTMNIMLSYHKLRDDWLDEKDYKSLLFSQLLKGSYKKSVKFYEKKEQNIIKHLNQLMELEKEECRDLDLVSNEFGYLMSELILYKEDHWETILRKVGFYLGKYIYILDAYLDLDKDIKNGSYNPFIGHEHEDLFMFVENVLMLNLSFLNNEIEKLPLIEDKSIIDNIIYSGMLMQFRRQCKVKVK